MRLIEAYNLLVSDGIPDNHRYFAEVYKTFQFKDEDSLKDYVDFILHEPTHWLRGFPPKLTSKNAFAKPKTAVIKLLKKPEVQADLGEAAAETAHASIWSVFKRDADAILAERTAHGGRRREPYRHVVEHVDQNHATTETNDVSDSITVQSLDEEPLPHLPESITPNQQIRMRITPTEEKEEKGEENVGNTDNQQQRIETLKTVCLKLAETLPPSVSDAFRILIAAV